MPKLRPEITLDEGRDLSLDDLNAVWMHPLRVRLSPSLRKRVQSCRALVDRALNDGAAHYGINTGIASLCDTRIDRHEVDVLQENLLRSHAVGVGEPVPDEIVRWMLLFKIHALSLGYSGVRVETLKLLAELLNKELLPVVPSRGSLGASGDLAPLAHLALPLIGRGKVRHQGVELPTADALEEHGLKPIRLAAKEGLALINGTQFMTAYGAGLCVRALRACKVADIIAAMALGAIGGSLDPFDKRMHDLRPHPGAVEVAGNLRALLADRRDDSPGAPPRRVQDPYSVRCVPPVHGAARDVLRHVTEVVMRDVNSVTDNPIVHSNGDILSGGNFHGEPVALALDYLACGLSELASISERRVYLLLNNGDYGLPRALVRQGGLNSGFLIAQYTAASLVAENKVLAHPASVDSIPTSGGQEDHVSMGATSAVKCRRIMDNVETALGIELAVAAQALDFRTEASPLAPVLHAIHKTIRSEIDHLETDRELGEDFETARKLATSDKLIEVAEAAGAKLI